MPDCGVAGATVQTSASSASTDSSNLMPGASQPSSFVTSIFIDSLLSSKSCILPTGNPAQTNHHLNKLQVENSNLRHFLTQRQLTSHVETDAEYSLTLPYPITHIRAQPSHPYKPNRLHKPSGLNLNFDSLLCDTSRSLSCVLTLT